MYSAFTINTVHNIFMILFLIDHCSLWLFVAVLRVAEMLLAYVGNPRCLAPLLKILAHGQIRVLTWDEHSSGARSTMTREESILRWRIWKKERSLELRKTLFPLRRSSSHSFSPNEPFKQALRLRIAYMTVPEDIWTNCQLAFNLFVHITKYYMHVARNNSFLFRRKKSTWKEGEKEREENVLKINPNDSRFNPRSNLLDRWKNYGYAYGYAIAKRIIVWKK